MLSFLCIIVSFFIPVMMNKPLKTKEISIGYTTKNIEATDFKTFAETFLIFVMASQKLEEQPKEVLKAMAILDRTWLWCRMEEVKEGALPEERETSVTVYLAKALGLPYLNLKQMKDESAYYQQMQTAVMETSGKAMQRDGKYFIPDYHQIGSEDYLYPGVGSIYYFKHDMKKQSYPSNCIKIDEWNGGFRVTVLGEGSGKGLDIAKASELAKSGWNYRQILYYFFHVLV